jgi:hypothetical protein
MGNLHSVVFIDAGWIGALLIGLLIEARLSKVLRRPRPALDDAGPGWLRVDPTRLPQGLAK